MALMTVYHGSGDVVAAVSYTHLVPHCVVVLEGKALTTEYAAGEL